MYNKPGKDLEIVSELKDAKQRIRKELSKIIIGHELVLDELLIALFSKGHVLLVGVPGLAKTLLVSSLSKILDLQFSRIQFTPDLMPSDITGTEIIEQDQLSGKRHFKFVKGPLFGQIILADEINRTPPKTQSALLEAMQEHKITAAGKTYDIEPPFFVLATQNPIEQEGTYPLPEAQLDRFFFQINLDYPSFDEEKEIIKTTTGSYAPELQKILNSKQIQEFQDIVRKVPLPEHVADFAIKLVRASRPSENLASEYIKNYVSWGAGPRAVQALVLGAKARAVLDGRFAPGVEDIKYAFKPALRHRIIPNFRAEAESINSEHIIEHILGEISYR